MNKRQENCKGGGRNEGESGNYNQPQVVLKHQVIGNRHLLGPGMIINPRAADSTGGNASRRWSVSARAQCNKPFRSLHSTGRFGAWGHGRRNHQAEPLQQLNRALRRSPPNKLASFSLAILHVDIAARILQAAALERAVHEHSIVQDHVLVLEDLILMSIHGITRGPGPRGNTAELRNCDMFQPGHCLRLSRLGWREEAIIHPRWMQADVSPKHRAGPSRALPAELFTRLRFRQPSTGLQ